MVRTEKSDRLAQSVASMYHHVSHASNDELTDSSHSNRLQEVNDVVYKAVTCPKMCKPDWIPRFKALRRQSTKLNVDPLQQAVAPTETTIVGLQD